MQGGFATVVDAIVTADAVIGETTVVDNSNRNPGTHGMAAITFLRRGYVRGVLTLRNRAIVTTAANADDFIVVDGRGQYRCPTRERS